MTQKGKHIEIFTAGCPVCENAVEQVKKVAAQDCHITVYDLNKGCETNICREKAQTYGVKAVPAVAIDGKLIECCSNRGIDINAVQQQCIEE